MKQPNIPSEVESLGISIDMIIAAQNDEEVRSKTYRKDIESKFLHQINLENDFLAHNKWTCPPSVQSSILEKHHDIGLPLSPLDESGAEGDRGAEGGAEGGPEKKYILSAKSLDHLACVANNINLFDGPSLRTGYSFIRKLITKVRLIGTDSANGFAMHANLYDKYKDAIVIKAPRGEGKYLNESMNHEIVVGKVLNDLRSYIPNFSFIIGSFDCGPPILAPTTSKGGKNHIISWCRGGKKVKYIMYENIRKSVSMYDFCKTCTAQEYIDVILQINYALMFAYKKHGFTHYDLHGGNILISDIGGASDDEDAYYIPYNGDFVYATKLASIIDYGYSHVYLPGTNKESVGKKDPNGSGYLLSMFKHGIYPDQPHPLIDCYTILNATIGYMKHRNDAVFEVVKGLMYYFHPKKENIDDIFSGKSSEAGSIPYFGTREYMQKIEKFRYESFIRYCREYCQINEHLQLNDPVISGKEYTDELDDFIILSPNTMNNLSPGKDKKLNLNNNITTIEELFDIIEPISIYKSHVNIEDKAFTEQKIISYNKFIGKIYRKIVDESPYIIELLRKELEIIKKKINNKNLVSYKSLNRNEIYLLRYQAELKQYLESFEASVQYLDFTDYYERKLEMIKYINDNILNNILEDEINEVFKIFKNRDDRMMIINFLKKDRLLINDYLNTKKDLDKEDEKIDTIFESINHTIKV